MNSRPTSYALRFFRWFCDPDYAEDIEGDLLERYERRKDLGKAADRLLLLDVLRLFRPGIIRKPDLNATQVHAVNLVSFFLKTSTRNLKRQSGFSLVNLVGLSVALTAVFCIYQYVTKEYHTDSLFENKDNLYRLVREVEDANASYKTPTLSANYYHHFTSSLGIDKQNIVRVHQEDELITFQQKTFFEENFLYADRHFFDLLDFQFELGSKRDFTTLSNAVVISKDIAKKYFGTENPIGKIIELDGKDHLQIAGVLANQKTKSHLQPDFVASITSMGYTSSLLEDDEAHAFTYYALSSIEDLPSGQIDSSDPSLHISWQPVPDIYFDKQMQDDHAVHGDKDLVASLVLIGLLILIVAGANFFNALLTTLTSKIKDFGVRKMLGSTYRTEILKVFVETYIQVCFALVFAMLGGSLLLLKINDWYDIDLVISYDLELFLYALGLSFLLTLVFSVYPGLIVSSTQASSALSRKIQRVKVSLIQEGILVFQFAICMVLVVVSLIVSQQYKYLQQKDPGLDPDQVVFFHSNNKHSWIKKDRIKDQIKRLPGVEEIAMSYGGLPSTETPSVSYQIAASPVSYQWKTASVSTNFLSLLQLDLLAGRAFDPSLTSDINNSAIVNKTAAKLLGWPENNILGTTISNMESESETSHKIIGVVDDFHFDSFKKQVEPTVLISTDWEETFIVKLNGPTVTNTLNGISEIWKTHVPGYPFTYYSLEKKFDSLIAEDIKQRNLLNLFSGLALFVALSGLLGLTAHVLQSKKKEIAIRSVLGASEIGQLRRISFNHLKLMIIAALIAAPFSLWFSWEWLSGFSYHVQLTHFPFLIGITGIMVIVLTIQGMHISQAIKVNPVDALKDE